MKRTYEVRDRADKRAIREFLKREGQFLLPMLELVEQTEVAIDEVIQVMGRATIEAVLEMSAEGVAGVKQAGRSRAEDDTVWYGRQGGVVYLSDRKVRVERPRLRRRGAGEGGEVEVPAYAAMRRPGAVADRMLEVLMAGVSHTGPGFDRTGAATDGGVPRPSLIQIRKSQPGPGRRRLFVKAIEKVFGQRGNKILTRAINVRPENRQPA